VTVIPSYDWPDLPRILDGHGIFLFPSPAEGCSLAMLEAMAGGLAPVTTRTGYAADLIKPGHNGFLAEAGDVEGYAAPILALAAHPKTALAIGRQARRDMADHAWTTRAAERTALWDAALAGPRRR
jgi:glycosyltransferase involved in cell wall biosynthesis